MGMVEPSESARRNPPISIARTVPPFVGRRHELDWFEHTLQGTTAGHPQVVLLEGEAGIGKTRLLRELRDRAVRGDIQGLYGRCYEDLALPYLPFIEALRPLLEWPFREAQRTLTDDLDIISRFFYSEGATRTIVPFQLPQSDQDKLQLFLAVSRTVVTLAQCVPTLCIIDDLHWADRSSLDLLSHIVFTVADAALREPTSLLLIATYRPVESKTPLARLIARLQRERICQTLNLSGLNENEIRQFIQGVGLRRPSQQLTATVTEATQGNPLFVQEVLHHLVQRNAVQERGGYLVTTATAADLPLPEQVTGAILSRARRFSKGCQEVLTLASFLGDHFSLQPLSAVCERGEDVVLSLLEEGLHQRLVISDGEGFEFAHPLIRHVFYNEPSPPRRKHLHHQIARTLERVYAESLEGHLLEIAHHFIKAGPSVAAEKIMRYGRRAGEQAFAVFAWDEAAHYYEAALAAAEATGGLTLPEKAELHYWAGLAHYWNQDVGPCLAHYEKAVEAYRMANDIRGLAQVLMRRAETRYTLASVPLGTLIDVQPLKEVLEALGEREPRLRGRILAIMSENYRMARQTDKAKELATQALTIGQHLQDDHLCSHACSALALAHIQGLHVREALESWQRALVYARRANDLILQGWPLQRIPLPLILQGRLEEAEAVAREACELTRKTQDWGDYSVALSHLATIAVAKGDFTGTERYTHETLLMADRSSYFWGGVRALFALACAHTLRGAWSEAIAALDLLIQPANIFQEAGPIIHTFARAFRLLVRSYTGTIDEPIEPFAEDLRRAVGSDTYSLAPLCALVEICDFKHAPTLVELPSQALSRAVERGVIFSSGWMFLIPRVLGVADAVRQRWDQAEAHFRAAIDVATAVGARPELGRTYLDYARMLVARAEGRQCPHADELMRQAITIFDELGMRPFG